MAKIIRQAGKVAVRIVLLLAIFGLILYSVKMLTPAKAEEDSVIDPQIAELIQAAELLTNGDFEDDGGMGQHSGWEGDVPGWLRMGGADFYQHSDMYYCRGTYALAMWRQDWKQGSGLVQVVPAGPDDFFTISGSMLYSATVEPLTSSSLVLRLEFWDDAHPTGTLLERITAGILSADDPADTWKDVQTLGLAPAGTSEARVVLNYYGLGVGKAHFDDISLVDENTTGEAGGPIPADGAVVDASTTTVVKWVNAVGTGPTEVEVLLAIEGGPNSTILTRQVISSWVGQAPLPLLDEDTDYVWTVNYYDDSSDTTPEAALRSAFNTGDAPAGPRAIDLLDPHVWLNVDDNSDPNLKHLLDGFITEFSDEEKAPGALYGIGTAYESAGEKDKAFAVYQVIVDNWEHLLERFSAKFLNEEQAPAALYEEGTAYESAGAKDKAFAVYQAVLNNWTENIRAAIAAGNDPNITGVLDELIAEFADNPDLPEALCVIGEEYGVKASELKSRGLQTKAREYYRKAVALCERVIHEFPDCDFVPRAYYHSAGCYGRGLAEYEKAIEYYQKLLFDWPGYHRAARVQFLIGKCYESLKDAGTLQGSEADLKIEQAYKAVLENYPDSASAKDACLKLGWLNFTKGLWPESVNYWELSREKLGVSPKDYKVLNILYPLGRAYEELGRFDFAVKAYSEFINVAPSIDPRVEKVKARLEQLALDKG